MDISTFKNYTFEFKFNKFPGKRQDTEGSVPIQEQALLSCYGVTPLLRNTTSQ